MLFFLLACRPSVSPPVPDAAPVHEPPPAPAVPAAEKQSFVVASSLNLRAAPDAASTRLGRLKVNTVVRRGEVRGDWQQVKLGNGKQGWVRAEYLGAAPLGLRAAISAAQDATAEEQLVWWQRAAAIAPMAPEVLRGLEAAYRTSGDSERAAVVARQLTWPESILLVLDSQAEQPAVEFDSTYRPELGRGPLPREKWEDHGLDAQPWSLLLDAGPAIEANPAKLEQRTVNPCGGDTALWLIFDAEIPEGRRAVAAVRGTPPPSWRENQLAPEVSRSAAHAKAQAWAEAKHPSATVSLGAAGDHWVGEAYWPETDDEDFLAPLVGASLRVSGTDAAVRLEVVEDLHFTDIFETHVPVAQRDLTGDGNLELISEGPCSASALRDGQLLFETTFRCCGC